MDFTWVTAVSVYHAMKLVKNAKDHQDMIALQIVVHLIIIMLIHIAQNAAAIVEIALLILHVQAA